MASITYDMEIQSSIPGSKMFKAIFLEESNTLIPKIMPQAIKSVEIIEGDGGVGTIKVINFGEGSQFKSVKHRVDAIDIENLTQGYSIGNIEGDALIMGGVESITYHVKIVPTEDPRGCICKHTSIYHTKSEVHEITEDKIKAGKEKAMTIFKAVEAYLHANPDAA